MTLVKPQQTGAKETLLDHFLGIKFCANFIIYGQCGGIWITVMPISKCPVQRRTCQVSNTLGKVIVSRQGEHISYSWMFLCHERARFRIEFSRSQSWQFMKMDYSARDTLSNRRCLMKQGWISQILRGFFFCLQVIPNISNRSLPGHRREKGIHNCFTS